MNKVEAGRFLATAIMLDPKMPEPDPMGVMKGLWADLLAEVPMDQAEKALRAYYSSERYLEKRDTISPADVVQWWNARRRPNERERRGNDAIRALPRPTLDPERIQAGVDRVLTALRRGQSENPVEEVAERRSARSVVCPHCHAEAGRPCVRSGRDDSRAEMRNHHPSRVEASRTPEAAP